MIGTGSANDIVRGLGIVKIEDACKAIKQGKTSRMDVGRLQINGSTEPIFFLGTMSLGLGTTVNRYVEGFNQRHKILSGIKPFDQLLSGLYAVHDSFKKKKVPLRMEMEYGDQNNEEKVVKTIDFSLLVFLNTPYYANGLKLADAEGALFDGLLDACIINTTSFFNTLQTGIRVARGTHVNREEVTLIRRGFFNVSSTRAVDIQVDGEIIEGVREFGISVIPAALKVVVPA
jgi:diacylglycerol kinase family enzyme